MKAAYFVGGVALLLLLDRDKRSSSTPDSTIASGVQNAPKGVSVEQVVQGATTVVKSAKTLAQELAELYGELTA